MSAGVLFVGEAPGRRSDPGVPLQGHKERLAALAGRDVCWLEERARFANLLGEWPGSAGAKGALFPMGPAREAARGLLASAPPRLVLMGRRVARAFGLPSTVCYFEARPLGPGVVAHAFPHTSGINQWYNSEQNRRTAGEWLLGVLGG